MERNLKYLACDRQANMNSPNQGHTTTTAPLETVYMEFRVGHSQVIQRIPRYPHEAVKLSSKTNGLKKDTSYAGERIFPKTTTELHAHPF